MIWVVWFDVEVVEIFFCLVFVFDYFICIVNFIQKYDSIEILELVVSEVIWGEVFNYGVCIIVIDFFVELVIQVDVERCRKLIM